MDSVGDWVQIIVQLGVPTAILVFLVWKGIPWIDEKNEKHNKSIRELINLHEGKMQQKDEKIERIVQDSLENHQSSMKIIEANTRAITALSTDITGLKSTNNQLREQIANTEALTAQVKGFLEALKK